VAAAAPVPPPRGRHHDPDGGRIGLVARTPPRPYQAAAVVDLVEPELTRAGVVVVAPQGPQPGAAAGGPPLVGVRPALHRSRPPTARVRHGRTIEVLVAHNRNSTVANPDPCS